MGAADEEEEDEAARSNEDEEFDRIYPARIRDLSSIHWTPVAVAAEMARMLVTRPGLRVLDVGCGPAKFCLVAATQTDGRFTGVELREDLASAARSAVSRLLLSNVEILQRNITDVSFDRLRCLLSLQSLRGEHGAGHKIDATIPLSPLLFKRYNNYVASQLGLKPTRHPGCHLCWLRRRNSRLLRVRAHALPRRAQALGEKAGIRSGDRESRPARLAQLSRPAWLGGAAP